MALDRFRASALPNPPGEYDPGYMRQLVRVVELYFSQLDSRTSQNAEKYSADIFQGGEFIGDGNGINVPYAQLVSTADQSAAAIDQAYAVTYTGTDFAVDISITSSSRITFAHAGKYIISYSIQFQSTSNDLETIDVWLRQNGTDVAGSNTRFAIPARKSAGEPAYLVAVTPIIVDVVASNDYAQIMFRVSNTAVTVEHLPAVTYSTGVTPAIPSTPSVIVGVQFLSS
jgi:hypothetical protein